MTRLNIGDDVILIGKVIKKAEVLGCKACMVETRKGQLWIPEKHLKSLSELEVED